MSRSGPERQALPPRHLRDSPGRQSVMSCDRPRWQQCHPGAGRAGGIASPSSSTPGLTIGEPSREPFKIMNPCMPSTAAATSAKTWLSARLSPLPAATSIALASTSADRLAITSESVTPTWLNRPSAYRSKSRDGSSPSSGLTRTRKSPFTLEASSPTAQMPARYALDQIAPNRCGVARAALRPARPGRYPMD